MIVDQERCIRLPAVTVERRLRFHSSQPRVDQSTVKSVIRSIDHHAGIRIIVLVLPESLLFFIKKSLIKSSIRIVNYLVLVNVFFVSLYRYSKLE
jgi:hypothetical protein